MIEIDLGKIKPPTVYQALDFFFGSYENGNTVAHRLE